MRRLEHWRCVRSNGQTVRVLELSNPAAVAAELVAQARALLAVAKKARSEGSAESLDGVLDALHRDAGRLVFYAHRLSYDRDATWMSGAAFVEPVLARDVLFEPATIDRLRTGLGVIADELRSDKGVMQTLLADGTLLTEMEDPDEGRCWLVEAWRDPMEISVRRGVVSAGDVDVAVSEEDGVLDDDVAAGFDSPAELVSEIRVERRQRLDVRI